MFGRSDGTGDPQNKVTDLDETQKRKAPSTAFKPGDPRRVGKPPANAWKPGQSGNPGGRPRRAYAACEAVRELVDPREWIAAELAVARDESKPWDVRRDAWRALIDRGFVKPPTGIEVSTGGADEPSYDHLSLERRRELLAELEGGALEPETRVTESPEHKATEPALSDENVV